MEWNASHNDIKFSEATQGRCFADPRWDAFARNGGDGTPRRHDAGPLARPLPHIDNAVWHLKED